MESEYQKDSLAARARLRVLDDFVKAQLQVVAGVLQQQVCCNFCAGACCERMQHNPCLQRGSHQLVRWSDTSLQQPLLCCTQFSSVVSQNSSGAKLR